MMEEEGKESSSLKKAYYKNCPGCKVDQLKESRTGLPVRELLSIWMISICNAIPMASFFPFLYFMIRDFGVAKHEEDIGSYVGYVGSVYVLGCGLTSILWGTVSDRYGRKPVMIIGTNAVVIFYTLFGLSSNIWMAISIRFLHGVFSCLIVTMKAYTVEFFRKEHQALGFAAVTTAWGIGLVIGPALGGFLAQPADKYPHIFPKGSFFDKYPYFLPCFSISVLALAANVCYLWLPETLHKNHVRRISPTDQYDALETADVDSAPPAEEKKPANENLLKNWALISYTIVSCAFSVHDIAYSEIFSMWAVSPRKLGGLSYTTDDVGVVLSISGLSLIVSQVLIYPRVDKFLGPIRLCQIGGVASILLLQCYPFMTTLSGFPLSLALTCASILKIVFSVSIMTGLTILQNTAVKQHQRGAANGLAGTVMSFFHTLAPAGGGALFSYSRRHQNASFLSGNHLMFLGLNVIEGAAVLMTFKLFPTGKKSEKEKEEKRKLKSDDPHPLSD